MEQVPEDSLHCLICLDLPENQVFQCRNGHVICDECCKGLQICPQCRVPYEQEKIRSRVLEGILENLPAKCPFKKYGCNSKVLKKDRHVHQESCHFRPVDICKHLGFPNHTFFSHDPVLLERHLRTEHAIRDLSQVTSVRRSYLPKQSGTAFACRALGFLNHNTLAAEPNCRFLLCVTTENESCHSFQCIRFGKEDAQWDANYDIVDTNKMSQLSWKVQPIHFKKVENLKSIPSMRIPVAYLKDFHKNPEILCEIKVTIAIRKQGKESTDVADIFSSKVSAAPRNLQTFSRPPKPLAPPPPPPGNKTSSSSILNNAMVDTLVSEGYVKTKRVEEIMRAVDRGLFAKGGINNATVYKNTAWRDQNLHLSSPVIYASVLEALELQPGLTFLNIGSGTGYLSTMCGLILGENGFNRGIDVYPDVVEYSKKKIVEFQTCNTSWDFCVPHLTICNFLHEGESSDLGYYDRIYCGAACPETNVRTLRKILMIGGICIVPVNDQLLKIRRTSENEYQNEVILSVKFAPLVDSI